MLKIGTVKWRGKCTKHPAFNPAGIRAAPPPDGCEDCAELVAIHQSYQNTLRLIREFGPDAESKKKRAPAVAERQQSLFA